MRSYVVALYRDRLAVDAKPRDLQAKLHASGRIDAHESNSRHGLPLFEVEIRRHGLKASGGKLESRSRAIDQEARDFDDDLVAA